MNNIRKKTEICLDPPVQTTATVEKTQIVAPNTGFGASTFNVGLLVVFAVVVFAAVLMLASKKKKIILPVLAVVTLALSVVFAPVNVVNAKIDGCKNVGYSEYDILVKMSYEAYSTTYNRDGDPVTTQTDNFSKEVVIPGTGDKQKDLENVIKIIKETTTDKGNKFNGTNIVTPEWNNPDQVYEIKETKIYRESSRS